VCSFGYLAGGLAQIGDLTDADKTAAVHQQARHPACATASLHLFRTVEVPGIRLA